MSQPYSIPHSFYPNAPPPHTSSFPLQQHALPAQTVSQQQQQQQQLQENISQQSHPPAHHNHIHNGIPSEEQHAAVLTLQSIPIPTIFSYLQGFRSSLRHQTAFYPIHLSRQQYQAFLALTDCSDELVSTLLNYARFSGSLASSQNYDSSTLGNGRVPAGFLTQSPSLVSIASTRNTLSSPSVQSSYNLSSDNSVGLSNSSTASSNEHDRWCFICENPTQPFRTADGFKRHLREHFTRYYCVPQKPLVLGLDGPRCASCNLPNPDLLHLNTHVTDCVGRKFTRKCLLIHHLKTKHNVHDGSVLAGHSECSVDLKYFACGFCVFCCDSLITLANHVDAHHYKISQHIRHWDNDKVIRGLLSQPNVVECWQAILASNPPLQEPWLRRMPALVEQLKHRLEMSRKPAETLRNPAIDTSNYRSNWYGCLETVSADLGMVANQTIEPFERQDATSPLSFNSEQRYGVYPSHTAAPSPQLQHPARERDRSNYMDFEKGRRYPRVNSETYGSPSSPVYRHPPYRAQPFHPSSWSESFMQGQYPAYSSSPASVSGTSGMSVGQARSPYYQRLGAHSSGLSPNLVINAQSGHELETYTTPAQAPARWDYPASITEAASSALSRDHNISPQSHFNDTHNPRVHPLLPSHLSRQEPAQRRIIDMDADSDDQQRLTQTRGRSRRQRRDH